jgi:chromate transporter
MMQILLKLVVSFALIGLAAYGGGMVTIPLIQHEIVANRNWLSTAEMAQIVVIAQMTPGPIAINAATLTGFRVAGIVGAAVATMGVALPSVSILALLAPLIERADKSPHMARLKRGIQIAVLSLILFAVWSYGAGVIAGWLDLTIALASFVLLVVLEGKIHPIVIIVACGVAGLIIF